MPGMSRLRRTALAAGAVIVVAVGATVSVLAAKDPSLEREWDEDVRVLSGVETLPDGAVRLTSVRDWRYTRDAVVSKDYFAAPYDPADIQSLWLYEQELG